MKKKMDRTLFLLIVLIIAISLDLSGCGESSSKDITGFSIGAFESVISGSNITVTAPVGAILGGIEMSIIHTGVSVEPASGSVWMYGDGPAEIRVTADDGSTRNYYVTINREWEFMGTAASVTAQLVNGNINFYGTGGKGSYGNPIILSTHLTNPITGNRYDTTAAPNELLISIGGESNGFDSVYDNNSISWYVDEIPYDGTSPLPDGSNPDWEDCNIVVISAYNYAYTVPHTIRLDVVKDGVFYKSTIFFKVVR
ncbi:MAG: hypothetical protein FWC03_06785 [Treponema sp.]|nr:hypothetical protein [Treponema sp.]